MTGQASMWKLGEVRSNAKGGKFLCLEPLFWQSEASLEIPWEPRAFSEGQRPSVSFATDERSRLFWERAEQLGRIRARLRRKAHARGRAPAAAALCEAIARRLDAESQARASGTLRTAPPSWLTAPRALG